MSELKVGDSLWVKTSYHRLYRQPNGRDQGPVIERGMWIPQEITGETRVSWILGRYRNADRINKKKLAKGLIRGVKITREEVDFDLWFTWSLIDKIKFNIANNATPEQILDLCEMFDIDTSGIGHELDDDPEALKRLVAVPNRGWADWAKAKLEEGA